MIFTVKRSKWLRGEGRGNSYLRRERDGKMCCLGFRARAVGFTARRITGKISPRNLYHKLEDVKEQDAGLVAVYCTRYLGDTELCNRIMTINDSKDITEITRENQLKAFFKRLGDTVIFKD